jgi:hypothetical protein
LHPRSTRPIRAPVYFGVAQQQLPFCIGFCVHCTQLLGWMDTDTSVRAIPVKMATDWTGARQFSEDDPWDIYCIAEVILILFCASEYCQPRDYRARNHTLVYQQPEPQI